MFYYIFTLCAHLYDAVVVVDVRVLAGKNAAPVGWALLPVFETNTEYVASGSHQLPLFAGAVPLGVGRSGRRGREDELRSIDSPSVNSQ